MYHARDMPQTAPHPHPEAEAETGAEADLAPAHENAPEPGDHRAFDAAVEAVLVSADRPVGVTPIADALRQASRVAPDEPSPALDKRIKGAIARLNAGYDEQGRAFRIEPVAGGWRLMTRPEHADLVAAFSKQRQSQKLSRAAIETLAIVAYRQPITRASLEAIRGVACGEVLRALLERKLIMITGRAEELGRPMLYGTTRQFLDAFGLASLKDLPNVGDLLPPPERKTTEPTDRSPKEGTDDDAEAPIRAEDPVDHTEAGS